MNLAFPYWDFLFTLIYNLSLGRWVTEGLAATSVTTAMLAFAVILSELMHRRVSAANRPTMQLRAIPEACVGSLAIAF
jgi:hypothetical protein